MFSYRHAFHAGNHADVLKHITLLICIELLQKKDTSIMFIDTHAGTGIYDLQNDYAQKSAEAQAGILRLATYCLEHKASIPPAISAYLAQIATLNPPQLSSIRMYPGSSQLMLQTMRSQDKLRLMELHPTDFPLLEENVAVVQAGLHLSKKIATRAVQIAQKDGFSQLKAYLPPPLRRGLCLIDPSYENKEDYQSVLTSLEESIRRFATGVYLIWYPILQRAEAQALPEKLAQFCALHQLPYLQTELQVKSQINTEGLVASGMWVINPPWQLNEQLEATLEFLCQALSQDEYSRYQLKNVE